MVGSVLLGTFFGLVTSVIYLVTGGSILMAFVVYSAAGTAVAILVLCTILTLDWLRSRAGHPSGTGFGTDLQRE